MCKKANRWLQRQLAAGATTSTIVLYPHATAALQQQAATRIGSYKMDTHVPVRIVNPCAPSETSEHCIFPLIAMYTLLAGMQIHWNPTVHVLTEVQNNRTFSLFDRRAQGFQAYAINNNNNYYNVPTHRKY